MTKKEAMFELKDGQHYHGVWRANFNHSPELVGDLLAMMWLEDGMWIFRYRIRHFKDDKVWDSKDTRNAWEIKIPDQPLEGGNVREIMFEKVNKLWDILNKAGAVKNIEYFPINGSWKEVAKLMSGGQIEGFHSKTMSMEEARKEGWVE